MLLRINLATKTYLDRRKFNLIVGVSLLVLVLLLLFNISRVASNAGKLSSTGKELGLTQGKDAGVPQKDYQEVVARIKFANDIIEKKSFSWITLLDKLEGVVPDGVAISRVEPKPKTEELSIAGVAKTFGNLRQFLENLETSGQFRDVYLLNQSEVTVGDTQQGLSFSINCKVNLK